MCERHSACAMVRQNTLEWISALEIASTIQDKWLKM